MKVNRLQNYDFNEYNIQVLSTEIMAQVRTGIEDEIAAMFDRLTAEHTWSPECAANRHYYDGWATNKAWKVNKKVIIPCYGLFDTYDGSPRKYKAVEVLSDIEKILNFFDGNMTADVNLDTQIGQSFNAGKTRNVQCKFFTATFYKKGTSYGKKKYSAMDAEEKKVIDSFQGEKQYEKVLQNTGFYLATPIRTGMTTLLPEGENM